MASVKLRGSVSNSSSEMKFRRWLARSRRLPWSLVVGRSKVTTDLRQQMTVLTTHIPNWLTSIVIDTKIFAQRPNACNLRRECQIQSVYTKRQTYAIADLWIHLTTVLSVLRMSLLKHRPAFSEQNTRVQACH